MGDIVFMTVVGQNVFSQSWNQTDYMFEEPTPGLLSTEFGLNKTGIFVYNRCGSLEGELQLFPVVPLNPSDIRLEWWVCPLTRKSDQNLISPYNNTLESNNKVMRIEEMITNKSSSWLLNKFSLSAPWEMYNE